MTTDCNSQQLEIQGFGKGRRRVVANFEGGTLSSDGGLILLGETERKRQIIERFARCFRDHRDEEAIEWSEKAMRQNPLHPVWYHWNAAFVYAVAHQNERAIVESKKALAVHKNSASIRRILIAAHGQRGEWDEARRYAAEILERFPKFRLSTDMRNSPFQHEEERKHYWDLFRRAGLPD